MRDCAFSLAHCILLDFFYGNYPVSQLNSVEALVLLPLAKLLLVRELTAQDGRTNHCNNEDFVYELHDARSRALEKVCISTCSFS